MKIELLNTAEKPIKKNRLDEFKVGYIGVIRQWDGGSFDGWIVKRVSLDRIVCLDHLIEGSGSFCSDYQRYMGLLGSYYIETLPPGTEIKITL